jgi:hypothetical protein
VRIREYLGISTRRQRQFVRAMQIVLLGMVFIGLDRGDFRIVVNAGVGLAVTYVPALLERDYHIPLDAGLTLWITLAVFLHAVGTTGVPGLTRGLYDTVWWWDNLTHALSASVVAAAGYATARAIDAHSEAVYLPPRFTFVFVVLFVMAFGVLWEVLEFGIGGAAETFGVQQVLIQHGIDDSMTDLLFDAVGAVIVGTWGQIHTRLDEVVEAIVDGADRRGSP